MAEALEGFDPDEFRAGIHTAMTVGMANRPTDRPLFHWNDERTYARADAAGRPFNFSDAAVTTVHREPVAALCAVEVTPAEGLDTVLGTFDENHARLTFLDQDWATVADFDWVELSGVRYDFEGILPRFALSTVDVIVVMVRTNDRKA